ncbi:hypothetical protein EYC80_009189 [Monilinia laxa]|uniref:Extracellular membrane protein CFEM domain-containing protein n=1 Tax=Monilinia laxa TaxID=61186 RepID=A0A5N6K2R1_MONLA|nr:hypothetical protein EYC80_009189 [Monilinia laxa]
MKEWKYKRVSNSRLDHLLSCNLEATVTQSQLKSHYSYISHTNRSHEVLILCYCSRSCLDCISSSCLYISCGCYSHLWSASVYCTGTSNYACECASATFTSIENAAANCVIGACGLATAAQVLSSVAAVFSVKNRQGVEGVSGDFSRNGVVRDCHVNRMERWRGIGFICGLKIND